MSQTTQDSLENLRQRAKCPLCLTFYIRPKKLNNCSHVFCFNCLKRHLQNSNLNFPKCPMCRKPMLQPLSEINQYETARAEEDVADFVRQFEMCDVCNKPENPSLKCLQCNWFICENCIPCHSKLKPTHTTDLIINPNRDGKSVVKSAISIEYQDHEQTLFCIMCLKTLCSKGESCREHGQCHDQCSKAWTANDVKKIYDCRLFLKPLKTSNFQKNVLNEWKWFEPTRIVSIDQISDAAYEWLRKVFDDVKTCVDFLQEYQEGIYKIIGKNDEPEKTFKCVKNLKIQVDNALGIGKTLLNEVDSLLRMPTDIDTAIYLLKNEHKYLQFFQLRRTFLAETQLVNAICETAEGRKFIRQVTKCSLKDVGHVYQGIILTHKPVCTALLAVNRNQPLRGAQVHLSLLGKSLNKTQTKIACSFKEIKVEQGSLTPSNEIFYANPLLSKVKDVDRSPFYDTECYHAEISTAASNKIIYCQKHKYHIYEHNTSGGKQMCFAVEVSDTCTVLTNFVNIFIHPADFHTRELSKITVMIGNRSENSGLETLFVCFDKTDTIVYGTCVNTCILKSHLTTSNYHSKYSVVLSESGCMKNILTNKEGTFSLSLYKNCHVTHYNFFSTYYNWKYQTKITETCVPTHFLRSVRTQRQDKTSCLRTTYITVKELQNVPVKYLKLDILCMNDDKQYFVKHDFPNSLSIGVLNFTLNGLKLNTLCQVKEKDIHVPISDLKPLTVTETVTGECIAVCSVKSDNSKFVVIRPNKTDLSRIEFLDVIYPLSAEISEAWVDELEMSPQGEIVYVLKDTTGKCHSVFTQYRI